MEEIKVNGKPVSRSLAFELEKEDHNNNQTDDIESSWSWVELATLNESGNPFQPIGRGGSSACVIQSQENDQKYLVIFGGASRNGSHFDDLNILNLGWIFFDF